MQFINSYITALKEVYRDFNRVYRDIVTLWESETSQGFVIGLSVLTPIFGTLFFFAVLVNAEEYVAPEATSIISALQIDTNKLVVKLDENTNPLNAAEVELFFDPKVFLVTDLKIHPELCEERFVLTKIIDNTAGTVFYQCGTVTPFTGASTTLATITIEPLSLGTSPLAFGNNTNVLAHDGFGSNVTKHRATSTYAYSI
jgi:hypothetical protein